jgi:hypothetical protein
MNLVPASIEIKLSEGFLAFLRGYDHLIFTFTTLALALVIKVFGL